MRKFKILLGDGRQFSVSAKDYRHRNSTEVGSGYTFSDDNDRIVCFVPNAMLAAIIEEDSIVSQVELLEATTAKPRQGNGTEKQPGRISAVGSR